MVIDSIWSVLVGAGTTVTLTVVVMIALAINGLALFYLSAAVLVLERFARVVRRPHWVIVFGGLEWHPGLSGGCHPLRWTLASPNLNRFNSEAEYRLCS